MILELQKAGMAKHTQLAKLEQAMRVLAGGGPNAK